MVMLSSLIGWMRSRQAEGMTSFALPLDAAEHGDPVTLNFVPNEVYLEVRVQQIWLTNERELWREFQPFAAVLLEYSHTGERRTLPVLLGASQLSQKLTLISEKDAVEIRNVRVAGPIPYEGEDLSLLIALFRAQTKNWLAQGLNVIAAVADAVGAAGLAAAKPVADTIVSAVASFLEQDGIELRCGQYQSWSRPENESSPRATDLTAMHYVVMRRPISEVGPDPARSFEVRDGRLHARRGDRFTPYTDHDFVLLTIEPRRFRDDYKQLDFYAYWQQTQSAIVQGELASAERMWRRTAGALYTDELTAPQQQALYAEYQARYKYLLDQFADADERAFRGLGEAASQIPLDEQDPREILLAEMS
jgi:hypothetical protein